MPATTGSALAPRFPSTRLTPPPRSTLARTTALLLRRRHHLASKMASALTVGRITPAALVESTGRDFLVASTAHAAASIPVLAQLTRMTAAASHHTGIFFAMPSLVTAATERV